MSAAPAFAGLTRRGRAGGNRASGRRRQLSSDPLAPRLVRVPSVVAQKMGARIRDVLRHLGQEQGESWGRARLSRGNGDFGVITPLSRIALFPEMGPSPHSIPNPHPIPWPVATPSSNARVRRRTEHDAGACLWTGTIPSRPSTPVLLQGRQAPITCRRFPRRRGNSRLRRRWCRFPNRRHSRAAS